MQNLKPSLRVLILSTSTDLAGAEQQVLALAQGLLRRGHQVKIVSMIALGPLGIDALAHGIEVHSLEMTKGRADLTALLRFTTILRAWRPQIVHSHMIHSGYPERRPSLRVRVPLPHLLPVSG